MTSRGKKKSKTEHAKDLTRDCDQERIGGRVPGVGGTRAIEVVAGAVPVTLDKLQRDSFIPYGLKV